MTLSRRFRRLLLIPRARRLRRERIFADLDEMLDDIRNSANPSWRKYDWPDS